MEIRKATAKEMLNLWEDKDRFEDPCDVNMEMKPKACPCFWLLAKALL